MSEPPPLHFLQRYTGRDSILTAKTGSGSQTLKKLSYYSFRSNNSEQMREVSSAKSETGAEEPVDDIGGPIFLPSVEIVKRKYHHEFSFPSLPVLSLPINAASCKLMLDKISICNLICDYSDVESDQNAKKAKTAALKELISIISVKENVLNIETKVIDELFVMIGNNLFRTLPLIPEKYLVYDEDPLFSEVNWPHLSLIYSLLSQYQTNFPTDQHFTADFILKLAQTTQSCDGNEREQALQILINHTNANFKDMHKIMIQFSHICRGYIDRINYSFGVSPAIKYFLYAVKLPNFQEFDVFQTIFNRCIMPLLTVPHLTTFVPLLDQTFDFIIAKEASYAQIILNFLLKHWPISWPTKQLLYIHFINLVLEKLPLKKFSVVAPRVFKFYAQCLSSRCYKVAEASLKVWGNVKIIPMILDNTRIIFPIIIDPLTKMMKHHWNVNTRSVALNSYKQIHDIDPFVFDEISNKLLKKAKVPVENEQLKCWALVARTGAKTDRDVNLAKVLADIQATFVLIEEPKAKAKPSRVK